MVKSIIRSIINNQIWISLAAVFFYRTGYFLFDYDQGSEVIVDVIVFFSTFLIYNQPRISVALKNIGDNRLFVFSLLFSLFILISSIFILDWKLILYLSHLGVIAFYYNYPQNNKSFSFLPFRTLPFLKILFISYIWASIGSILHLFLMTSIPEFHKILSVFCIQFLFIFSITIPFDIRDYYDDKKSEILTIPGVIGIVPSKGLSFITVMVFVLIAGLTFDIWIPFILSGIIVIFLIGFSKMKNRYYYTGVIDGSIIVYWLILKLFQFLQ